MEYIAKGNRAAFDHLVQRHLDKTCAMAARLCGHSHDADDIVQDAFLQVWVSAPKWKAGRAKFTTWFYRIVMNKSIDNFRKAKKTRAQDEYPEYGLEDTNAQRPESEMIEKQEKIILNQAINSLPEKQRTAIILCYQKELSNKEAADIMDLHIKALEGLLVRGRKKLHDILSAQNFEFENVEIERHDAKQRTKTG